jgi:predicted cation transporter
VEEELETFLFIMGIISVTITKLWSWHLLGKVLHEPLSITAAVLAAGFVFRAVSGKLTAITHKLVDSVGIRPVLFLLVAGLGLLSSVITAIIAALILAEITTSFKLPHNLKIRIVILGCFAIGLGAVLTPLGEPLSTIAISKLKGEPYHAGFFFLYDLMAWWIIPGVLALGALTAITISPQHVDHTIVPHKPDTVRQVIYRGFRVYIFVVGLLLLGTGLTPMVDRYIAKIPGEALYWINTISAALDNATLTAAEITPNIPKETIRYLLIGLLVSGGILIPGNIPNIICANKLRIKSKEWAQLGAPLGLIMMLVYFALLLSRAGNV